MVHGACQLGRILRSHVHVFVFVHNYTCVYDEAVLSLPSLSLSYDCIAVCIIKSALPLVMSRVY